MTKIGIVGSRRRASSEDFLLLEKYLLDNYDISSIELVSGGCAKGADNFAEIIAEKYKIPITIYKPGKAKSKFDWIKQAYARNTQIAENSDVLIALVSPDRKGGTEDTIKKFKKSTLMLL